MPSSVACVDASLVVALVCPEEMTDRALALWERWMREDVRAVAPYLLQYEVTSALRRKVVRGYICEEDGRRALEAALGLDIELMHPPGLCRQAFELAARLGLPSAYHAQYLALAQLMDAPLWTADERLYNAVRASLPYVCWLGSYE